MKFSQGIVFPNLIILGFTNAEKILQTKQWKRSLKSESSYHGGEVSPHTYGSWSGSAVSEVWASSSGGWTGGNSGKGYSKGSSEKGGKSYGGGGVIKAGSGKGGGYVQLGNLDVIDGTTNQATCLSYNAGGTAGLDPCGSSFPNQWFVLENSSMSPIQGSFMIRHVASGMYLMAPTTCAEGDLVNFGFRGQPGTDFFNEGNGLSLTSVYCWATTSATALRDLAVTWDDANGAVQMTTEAKGAASTWMEVNQYFSAD